MLFFAAEPAPDAAGLILSMTEAARQRAQRRAKSELAGEAARRLLSTARSRRT